MQNLVIRGGERSYLRLCLTPKKTEGMKCFWRWDHSGKMELLFWSVQKPPAVVHPQNPAAGCGTATRDAHNPQRIACSLWRELSNGVSDSFLKYFFDDLPLRQICFLLKIQQQSFRKLYMALSTLLTGWVWVIWWASAASLFPRQLQVLVCRFQPACVARGKGQDSSCSGLPSKLKPVKFWKWVWVHLHENSTKLGSVCSCPAGRLPRSAETRPGASPKTCEASGSHGMRGKREQVDYLDLRVWTIDWFGCLCKPISKLLLWETTNKRVNS